MDPRLKIAAVNSNLGAGLNNSLLTDGIIFDEIDVTSGTGVTYDFFSNCSQHTPYLRTNMRENKFPVGEALSVYAIGFYVRSDTGLPSTAALTNIQFTLKINNVEVIPNARIERRNFASGVRYVYFLEGLPRVISPLMPFSVTATVYDTLNSAAQLQIGCWMYGDNALPNGSGLTVVAPEYGGIPAGLTPENQIATLIQGNKILGDSFVQFAQGTTLSLRDQETSVVAQNLYQLFVNFGGKTQATTNLRTNKLPAGYSMIAKEFTVTFAAAATAYTANLQFTIDGSVVLKYWPLWITALADTVPFRDYTANTLRQQLRMRNNLLIGSEQTFEMDVVLGTPAAATITGNITGYGKTPSVTQY